MGTSPPGQPATCTRAHIVGESVGQGVRAQALGPGVKPAFTTDF